MAALWRKELTYLVPMLFLAMFLACGELLFVPFASRLDEISWIGAQSELRPGASLWAAFVLYGLGLILAYSLFPREYEEGTIHFLHSLPISRRGIFLAKFLAAWTIVGIAMVVSQLCHWLIQLPNPATLSGTQFHLATAARMAFLEGALATVGLCHGMLLSFLRHYGLMLWVLGAWGLGELAKRHPDLGFLDPLNLMSLEYEGSRLLIPWGDLAFQGTVAALALGAAHVLWSRSGEELTGLYLRAAERGWGRLGLGCASLVLLVVGFLLMDRWSGSEEPQDVLYVSYRTARLTTPRYVYTYPVNLRSRALLLAKDGDAAWDRAARALGCPDGPPVVVDLTEVSVHHEGIASREKIRLDIVQQDDPERLLHNLCHEAVHVLGYRLGGRRLADYQDATAFFNEGLAQWMGFEVVPRAEDRLASRRHAVASWRRHRVRFRELADAQELQADSDDKLVYTLGETWVAALVDVYGRDAPGKVLRAVGRDPAPKDLEPVVFWQDTLQAAGYNLERVLARWDRLLADAGRQNEAFLSALPRLSGGVVGVYEGQVVVRARLDKPGPRAAAAVVRVREDRLAGSERTFEFPGKLEAGAFVFRFPRGAVRGERCQLQFGLSFEAGTFPVCERWQSAALARD